MPVSHDRLEGLIAAPHTPMTQDGSVRLEVVEKQVDWLQRNGVVGAFICGTTGEGLSLSVEERMQVARKWAEVGKKRVKVIVHVGSNCFRHAVALAADARKAGAYAIACLPPFYFRPANVDDLLDYLYPIAAAAPELPFYYYHIPSLSGVSLSMVELLEKASKKISSFRGMKYTHDDLMEYRQCVTLDAGRFDVLFGRDEILLPAMTVGAKGAVGSSYSFSAPIYMRIIEAYRKGNQAALAEWSDRGMQLIHLLIEFGIVQAGKAIMAMLGIDCGPPRPPLKPLLAEKLRRLEERLDLLGFLKIMKQPYRIIELAPRMGGGSQAVRRENVEPAPQPQGDVRAAPHEPQGG